MKQVVEVEGDDEDWVLESIIESGPSDNNPQRHMLLIKWKEFSQAENMWETYDNVADSDMRLLEDWYKRNPAVEKDGRLKMIKTAFVRKWNKDRRLLKLWRWIYFINWNLKCWFTQVTTEHRWGHQS